MSIDFSLILAFNVKHLAPAKICNDQAGQTKISAPRVRYRKIIWKTLELNKKDKTTYIAHIPEEKIVNPCKTKRKEKLFS